ncbi:hypothetical protein AB0X41_02250 [Lapidilactobacillus dextrinicus]
MAYTYDIKKIMTNAWIAARYFAKRHGGKAVEYIKSALKASWRAANVERYNLDMTGTFRLAKMSSEEFNAYYDYEVAIEKAFPDNGHTVQYLNVKYVGKSNINQRSFGEMADYTFLDGKGKEYVWSTKTDGYYVNHIEAGKNYVISFNYREVGGKIRSVKIEK